MNLGVPELLIILLIVVIFFGVGRLPELGGAIGKSIREFRKAAHDADSMNSEDHSSDSSADKEL